MLLFIFLFPYFVPFKYKTNTEWVSYFWYDNFTKLGFSICFGFIQIYTHHSHLFGSTCFSLYIARTFNHLYDWGLTIFKASNIRPYVDIFYLELGLLIFCIDIFSDVISQNVHSKFEHSMNLSNLCAKAKNRLWVCDSTFR